MEKSIPDYRRIYSDIIDKNFPHLIEEYSQLLDKKSLSVLDVLEINRKLFGIQILETAHFDQRHRSFHKSDNKDQNFNELQLHLVRFLTFSMRITIQAGTRKTAINSLKKIRKNTDDEIAIIFKTKFIHSLCYIFRLIRH